LVEISNYFFHSSGCILDTRLSLSQGHIPFLSFF
jgi:hypothetical protein